MPKIRTAITVVSLSFDPRTGEVLDPQHRPSYHALAIDQTLNRDFVDTQREKLIFYNVDVGYATNAWDEVYDLSLGGHTITLGNNLPSDVYNWAAILVNDQPLVDGYINSENFLTATFNVTKNIDPVLFKAAQTGGVVGDCEYRGSVGFCGLITWDTPFINNINPDPEGKYLYCVPPNASAGFNVIATIIAEPVGVSPYMGQRSRPVFKLDVPGYPIQQIQFELGAGYCIYTDPSGKKRQCYWTFPYLSLPIHASASPEGLSVPLYTGHIDPATQQPVWDSIIDVPIPTDPNAPQTPTKYVKNRIVPESVNLYLDVPIDPRPGRTFALTVNTQTEGETDASAALWVRVAELASLYDIDSTKPSLVVHRSGERVVWETLYGKITDQMFQQGYLTLEAGHFEIPPAIAPLTVMSMVKDDEMQIPLTPTVPPSASISAIRYTVSAPQTAASISAMRYRVTAPSVAASISAMRYRVTAPPPPPPPPPTYATLTGKVVGIFGMPVSGALVYVNGSAARTAPNGTFTISGLTLGKTYTLTVRHWLYSTLKIPVTITSTQQSITLTLSLNPLTLTAIIGGVGAFTGLLYAAAKE